MVPSSPHVPTAPPTPLAKYLPSSPLGGGDRFSDSGSLFGSSTLPNSARGVLSFKSTLLHSSAKTGRPLRRASPAPMPLSQYSTPRRARSDRTLPSPVFGYGASPTIAALSRSVIVVPPALLAASPQGPRYGEVGSLDEACGPFVAVAGDRRLTESPRSFNDLTDFPFHSLSSEELQHPDGKDQWTLYDAEEVQDPTFSALAVTFVSKCKFPKFNPDRPTLTNFDILARFGELFGAGVTKTELKQIFRQCTACQNLLYADRRAYHRCHGEQVNANAVNFDLVQALLGVERHSGLSSADFGRMTVVCDLCKRFCLAYLTDYHKCPQHGKD